MWIWKEGNWLPQCHCQQWLNTNGPQKAQRCRRLAKTQNANRHTKIPWLHRLLPLLCPRLLKDHTPTTGPHQKGCHMGMGWMATQSFWRAKNTHVLLTHPHITWLWKTILPTNRRIGIWCGHHTLAGGWTPCSCLPKTQITPNCILLCHLYTHQMELQHLQMGTSSNNESTHPLVTLPRMDKNPIYYPHWPRQPPILESPSETEPLYGMMACQPPRVWFHHQTHPWKDQHPSRWTIMSTQLWPGQKRQPRSNSPWTKTLH